MKETETEKHPSFGKLFAGKLIKTMIFTFIIWAVFAFAAYQYIRAEAISLTASNNTLRDLENIYFAITDLEMPENAKEFEHDPQSIEEIAASINKSEPDEYDIAPEIFDTRSACAVYDADTGEKIFYPDTEGFDREEIDILGYRPHAASLVFPRLTQTNTQSECTQYDLAGRYTVSFVRCGYVNSEEGTLYAVRMIYTLDYSRIFLTIAGVAVGVFLLAAVIAAFVSAKRAKKKTEALYSDCLSKADVLIEKIRQDSDTPINVIIGAAEGMRMAGDDRADNIIKNANLLKDIIMGTNDANEKTSTDN